MDYTECNDENEFKRTWIANHRKEYSYIFCIETEETVHGFPDVMALKENGKAYFFEFKYTQGDSIKFQPTQPAFYRRHAKMNVKVVAFSKKHDCSLIFPVDLLFREDSSLCLTEYNSCNLKECMEWAKGTNFLNRQREAEL